MFFAPAELGQKTDFKSPLRGQFIGFPQTKAPPDTAGLNVIQLCINLVHWNVPPLIIFDEKIIRFPSDSFLSWFSCYNPVFHGNHLLWSVKTSLGVIYVNAYSDEDHLRSHKLNSFKMAKRRVWRGIAPMGQTEPVQPSAGTFWIQPASRAADDEYCESIVSTGLASFLLKAKIVK